MLQLLQRLILQKLARPDPERNESKRTYVVSLETKLKLNNSHLYLTQLHRYQLTERGFYHGSK